MSDLVMLDTREVPVVFVVSLLPRHEDSLNPSKIYAVLMGRHPMSQMPRTDERTRSLDAESW